MKKIIMALAAFLLLIGCSGYVKKDEVKNLVQQELVKRALTSQEIMEMASKGQGSGFKSFDDIVTMALEDIIAIQDFSDTGDSADGTTKYGTLTELRTLMFLDTAYSSAWNGILYGATKNTIYDQFHLYDTDDDGDIDTVNSTVTLDSEWDTWPEHPTLNEGNILQGNSSNEATATDTLTVKAIALPTLVASELDDTTDPHTLIAEELKNKILSNSESTGADEWIAPARTENWNFLFHKEVDQNVLLSPNGTEQWYFRNSNAAYTQLSAGEGIANTTSGKSTLSCFSTESAVYCTGDANWDEETP